MAKQSKIIHHSLFDVDVTQAFDDGYVNVTALSNAYFAQTGKRRQPSDWLRLERTQEMMDRLASETGLPVDKICRTVEGRSGGTYAHPLLAVEFENWLNSGPPNADPDILYLISAVGVKAVKIGVTSNLDKRLSQMQVASPVKLKVMATLPTSQALEIESYLHSRLGQFRTHGEWFRLTDQEAIDAFHQGIQDFVNCQPTP